MTDKFIEVLRRERAAKLLYNTSHHTPPERTMNRLHQEAVKENTQRTWTQGHFQEQATLYIAKQSMLGNARVDNLTESPLSSMNINRGSTRRWFGKFNNNAKRDDTTHYLVLDVRSRSCELWMHNATEHSLQYRTFMWHPAEVLAARKDKHMNNWQWAAEFFRRAGQ